MDKLVPFSSNFAGILSKCCSSFDVASDIAGTRQSGVLPIWGQSPRPCSLGIALLSTESPYLFFGDPVRREGWRLAADHLSQCTPHLLLLPMWMRGVPRS